MFENLRNDIIAWNSRTSDRQKLQHTYVVLLAITVVLAGIFSLFSSQRSEVLLWVSLTLLTAMLANYFIWSLLKATVLDNLPRQKQGAATTRSNRRS